MEKSRREVAIRKNRGRRWRWKSRGERWRYKNRGRRWRYENRGRRWRCKSRGERWRLKKIAEGGGDMRKLGKEVAMEKSRRKGDIKVAKNENVKVFPNNGNEI